VSARLYLLHKPTGKTLMLAKMFDIDGSLDWVSVPQDACEAFKAAVNAHIVGLVDAVPTPSDWALTVDGAIIENGEPQ